MILDEDIEPKISFIEVVKYWETNRAYYNTTLFFGILIMAGIEYALNQHNAKYWVAYWNDIAHALIAANICFSIVYLVECWAKVKFKIYLSIENANNLYKFGVTVSLIFVFLSGLISIIMYN